jgi:hypothetical protein
VRNGKNGGNLLFTFKNDFTISLAKRIIKPPNQASGLIAFSGAVLLHLQGQKGAIKGSR